MDVKTVATVLAFVCGFQVVTAGEWCKTKTSKYCDYGCCGSESYEYCCVQTTPKATQANAYINIGVIVGAVVGGLILLSFIIAVIKLICACAIQSRPGQVIQPPPGAAIVMTHQPGYGFNPHQQYPPVDPEPGQTGNPAFPQPYPGQPQNASG